MCICACADRFKIKQDLKVGNYLLFITRVASRGLEEPPWAFGLDQIYTMSPVLSYSLRRSKRIPRKCRLTVTVQGHSSLWLNLPLWSLDFLPLLGGAWVFMALSWKQLCERKKPGIRICPVSPCKTQQGKGCVGVQTAGKDSSPRKLWWDRTDHACHLTGLWPRAGRQHSGSSMLKVGNEKKKKRWKW